MNEVSEANFIEVKMSPIFVYGLFDGLVLFTTVTLNNNNGAIVQQTRTKYTLKLFSHH